jgi:hypothetical protein
VPNIFRFAHAADRDAAEVDAVVAAFAPDQPGARALAAHAVVGDRHLQRGFHRLGARVGEEHLVHARGGDLRQRVGQLEGLRVRHVERRREVEFGRLLLDRFDDLRPRVAGVDAPQARHAVEHLPALVVPVVHAGRLGQNARRLLELARGGEGHPEGIELGLHVRFLGKVVGCHAV